MIGVFGGSGFYDFLDDARTERVDTPYGDPADAYTVGTIDGVDVAFLPRHGADHRHPAHRVPFRANVWGMRHLGVDRIIGPCAAGSLDMDVAPGEFVVCDQIVDRTWGRDSTFFDGPETVHVAMADPYCAELRPLALTAAADAGATVHDGGTVVVIQGPRFSTRAESAAFASAGWQVINMTQSPEAFLARELELCYVNISVVTDYDVGIEGEVPPVSHAEVLRQFEASLDTLRETIRTLVGPASKTPRECECAAARRGADG